MKNSIARTALAGIALSCLSLGAAAQEEVEVTIRKTAQINLGAEIGVVHLSDSEYGLMLTPNLSDLEPGAHGFHVHENGSCMAAEKEGKMIPGLDAGGHFDPDATESHEGPYHHGHRGDLPALIVAADGTATMPVLAPRLTLADVRGRALMIHRGGDTYSDAPKVLGGGGPRIACGVVPALE
ncbi:MAG: superoxide dismutase [Cu-Zn] SodC2 [Rhodospirillaceae bacterium]|jgi:Cu-Zn family superoxide dismutase|nr:superoxide dismutase [Cu-Zn] SodC2 [Rhodospirillaceae bacterium]